MTEEQKRKQMKENRVRRGAGKIINVERISGTRKRNRTN